MHLVFNVQDLSSFHGDNAPPIALPFDPSQVGQVATDKVDIVLDYRASKDPKLLIVISSNGRTVRSLRVVGLMILFCHKLILNFMLIYRIFHSRTTASKCGEGDVSR